MTTCAPPLTTQSREGNILKGFKDFRTVKGSRKGLNLALTGLFVPSVTIKMDGGVRTAVDDMVSEPVGEGLHPALEGVHVRPLRSLESKDSLKMKA